MAKTNRAPNPALLGDDAMSSDESAMMDADRDNEGSSEPIEDAAPVVEEAPAEQPELALETEEHEEPAIDPKTGQKRMVDYGALHAERSKRKTTETELAKQREENAKILGRFETIQQMMQRAPQQQTPQQPVADEIPDINLDPVGHFQAKDALRERELGELRQWRQSQQQQSDTYNNVSRLQQIAQSHEAEFKKTTPDYDDAFQYVRAQRDTELQGMGYDDPNVRQNIIAQDALQIAAQALQGNRNAAQVVYAIAKARGYAGKAPASAPAPVPVAKSPDAQKIATVAKGQEASQSLGQMGGTAPVEFSAEMIAKMSDNEFADWTSKNEDAWRKMMGG